jgi:ubiquinone/menaquinone biosynthesis C-methylase UbiE
MATRAPDPTTTGPDFTSEAVTEMMLDLAKIHVGDRVLELAAGMGDLAIMTARLVGPNGYVLATDISANMLDLAAETLREAGLTNVETRVMDAENLDVAPDSFNVALCRSALMLFPHPVKTLAGVHRALKPSGKFAVTVWSTAEKNPFHALPLSIVSRLAKIPLPASRQSGLFVLSGGGVLEDCYKEAGFRDVAVRAVSVRRHFPSTAEAIEAMKGSFPRLQVLLNKLSDADHALAWNEIEQQLRQFEGPNGFEAPGEWLVGVGTK